MNNEVNNNGLNNGTGIDPTVLGSAPIGTQAQPVSTPIPDQTTPPVANPTPVAEQPVTIDNTIVETPPVAPVPPAPAPQAVPTPSIEPAQPSVAAPISSIAPEPFQAVPQPIPGTNPIPDQDLNKANSNGFVEPTKVESIGTVPPPQEEKAKKPMNKVLFVILILLLMGGVAFGVYYYLSLGQSNVSIQVKNLQMEVNTEKPASINDYATITGTSSKNCNLFNNTIDTTTPGKYTFTIKCGKVSKTGEIEVIDKEPLTMELKEVQVKVGEEVSVNAFIVDNTCTKSDCTAEFADEQTLKSNLQTPGNYEVGITIKSGSESNTINGKLTVVSNDFKLFLSCSLKNESDNSEIIDKIAIGQTNSYIGYGYRVYKYTFTDEAQYKAAIGDKKATITYKDITGSASYDDENKTLTITTPLQKETVDAEYGSTFPESYSVINQYYSNKGYVCIIEEND